MTLPSPRELADLVAKYEEILAMRLDDEAHPGGDPRLRMAALAARFPGALRELDELPLPTVRARIAALSRCASDEGRGVEPWMVAMARFHPLARGALRAKRWLGARKAVDAEVAASFARWLEGAGDDEDARAWATDLAALAAPPRGRLMDLVYARVAAHLGTSSDEARGLLHGTPRRGRTPR